MSFNYLEVAHAAEILARSLPATAQSVELVEFPVGMPAQARLRGAPFLVPLQDLCIGIRLDIKRMLVFSLHAPWTAVFLLPPGLVRASKRSWGSVFGGALDWNARLKGMRLESLKALPEDRILELNFNGAGIEAVLRVELFPARPNWVLSLNGQVFPWKSSSPRKRQARAAPFVAELRNFDACAGGDWFEKAYRHYLELRWKRFFESHAQKLSGIFDARFAHFSRIQAEMRKSLESSQRAGVVRAQGEALKAILHQYPAGFRAEQVAGMRLDPKLSLPENALRLFERYKKLQRTGREVELRLSSVERELKGLGECSERLSRLSRGYGLASGVEGSKEACQKLVEIGIDSKLISSGSREDEKKTSKKTERKWKESGLVQFSSKEGLTIFVGRNHAENEQLVMRIARGNDVWMHLKGRPGAHVVIPLPRGKSPSLDTLLDGAMIAAHYSGAKDQEKVEVDYTFCKNVKRIPGKSDQFLVAYAQNKTLVVKIEKERLCRLLKQH